MADLENRVTKLEESISILLELIKEVNQSITSGFEKVERNFEDVDKNLAIVNRNIDAIRGKSKATLETVEVKLQDLTSEIRKINDISGYNDIFANNDGLKIVRNSN